MSNDNNVISLEEFSAKIGVSTAAVSSVFNNRSKERRISEKTVELIKTQAKKLGYQPNVAAKRLRVQKDMNVCELAVLTAYESPFAVSSNLVHALESIVSQHYKNITPFVEIVMFHRDRISELPGILDGSRFNGAIITNTGFEDDKFFMENEVMYPIVFLGRDIQGYSCVRDDDFYMGEAAANELVNECGCKNVAVVAPQMNLLTQTTKKRYHGFLSLCKEKNIKCDFIQAQGIDEQSGAAAVESYLERNKIDGLYSVSDLLAIGAYYAIKKKGLLIPGDIAVVGVGDVSAGEYLDPPLTAFSAVNVHKKDDYAAKMLLAQLFAKKNDITSNIFHPEIVRRGSTTR